MTYLTGSSILTGKDFAIHNNSTTYTCSKRNHNDIVKTASAATPLLTKSCNICIITNLNFLNSGKFTHLICNRENPPAEICTLKNSSVLCYRPRNTHANTENIVCLNRFLCILFLNRLHNVRKNIFSIIFFSGNNFPLFKHIALFVKKSHLDRSSTYINSINILCHIVPPFFLLQYFLNTIFSNHR